MARVNIPAGSYAVRIASTDGAVGREEKVVVRKGKTTFVIVDDVR
jgi:hypothetical protein